MNLLEMNHIKKSFGRLEVLKDISLHVKEGEVLSIIGPSGSGKSTLLRCATMLETIDDGDIIYLGQDAARNGHYAKKSDLKKIQEYFGLVFQNFNLFPHRSVMQNIVDAPILVQKRPKDEVYAEARTLLKKMGLESKEHAYPFELSGGQQQRVSIARALAMNPKILFFDEPTSAL
ncbi:MAG: amino acid ABC transporter ATP-binding protein, partial [Butyricicoccaceae bacterium]